LYKLYPLENTYFLNAIKYYQKALDNGYNKAAIKLKDLYLNNGDIENADKYLIFDFWTREP